jgi:hypothetical protein
MRAYVASPSRPGRVPDLRNSARRFARANRV